MRRIARIIIGSIVLLAGLMLFVLPGPAFIVIPLGLSILAIDLHWARALVQMVRIWIIKKQRSELDSSRPR